MDTNGHITTLKDLAGDWVLSRTIDDRYGSTTMAMEGTAAFTRDGEDWFYRESGTLTPQNGSAMQAERTYIFRETPGGALVLFRDGSPFHLIRWSDPVATHFCEPDTYRVAYDIDQWPQWTSCWTVTGPRKDYVSTTVYTRP